MDNRLREVLASVLEADISTVENPSSENTEGWDSLKQMVIIAAVEEEFGVMFDEEKIIHLNSFNSLKSEIEKLK